MDMEIIFHIIYYLNFLCIVYSSLKLLSYLYHYIYFYILYISYIINIFHTLYIICINYIILVSSKNLPCTMLTTHTIQLLFFIAIPLDFLFICIITPVHFFILYTYQFYSPLPVQLFCLVIIPYSRVSVKH